MVKETDLQLSDEGPAPIGSRSTSPVNASRYTNASRYGYLGSGIQSPVNSRLPG
jgi:hypothetical protein